MSRAWRIIVDCTFLLAMVAIIGFASWQLFTWWRAPVSKYPNAREALGALAILALSLVTAFSVIRSYISADEDSGRVPATIWIVIGLAPFVASLVSPVDGDATGTIVAGCFTVIALCYRFQRRGWLI